MGLIFKKGKFGKKNFKFGEITFRGSFYRPKLSDKTGLVLVGWGTILIYSSLFSLKSEKKILKIKNLGFWGCFFFGLNFFDFCRFLDIEI